MSPKMCLLRPFDLLVGVSPLGAQGTAQASTGTGGGAPLTAQSRVPEACNTQTQKHLGARVLSSAGSTESSSLKRLAKD